MEPKKRREQEAAVMKELILDTAARLIAQKGTDQLSIRKIAAEIGYTPGIIYHYFQNKDDIISQCMQQGYRRVVQAVSLPVSSEIDPIKELQAMTKRYMQNALEMGDQFIRMHLSQSADVQQYTTFLHAGAAMEKSALKQLYDCLARMHRIAGEPLHPQLEMLAQLIASSTFGVISKLVAEKGVPAQQQEALIEYFADIVVVEMAKGGLGK